MYIKQGKKFILEEAVKAWRGSRGSRGIDVL
jgi:hypothetical protein